MGYWTAINRSTLMAVIVLIEIPQRMNSIISDSFSRSRFFVSSLATKNGWEINPTRRSETAKLSSITIEDDRMRGVFIIAVTTNVLPLIEIRISGAFRAQFTMTSVLCEANFLPSIKLSVELILHSIVEFIFTQMMLFIKPRTNHNPKITVIDRKKKSRILYRFRREQFTFVQLYFSSLTLIRCWQIVLLSIIFLFCFHKFSKQNKLLL